MVLLDGKVEGFLVTTEGCFGETLLGTSDGDNENGSSDNETNKLSTFGPPLEPTAVTRTIFMPGLQTANRISGCQSLQEESITKGTSPAHLPFIVTSHGRPCHLPLEYRNCKVHGPPEDPPSISDNSKNDPCPPMSTYPVPV